jgi:AcrR family transcriptional regulator
MKIKEKTLRKTTEFLIKEGCRKVTVDEIAAYNGISKRTLYELFLDKNDIIEQSLLYCNEKTREYYHEVFNSYDDNIISVILSGQHFRPDNKITSACRLFADEKNTIRTFMRMWKRSF